MLILILNWISDIYAGRRVQFNGRQFRPFHGDCVPVSCQDGPPGRLPHLRTHLDHRAGHCRPAHYNQSLQSN